MRVFLNGERSILSWITAKNIEPDWAAMTVLREYSREELSGLCDNIVE